jgi:uncharacterized protein (DUF3820 family)
MAGELVRFGKYRGRAVEELLADRDYVAWLEGQGWFRARYGHWLELQARGEDHPTPEHNRLQVLFLDEGYRAAFVRVAVDRATMAGWLARALGLVEADREKVRAALSPPPPSDGRFGRPLPPEEAAQWTAAAALLVDPVVTTSAEFEKGCDVEMMVRVSRPYLDQHWGLRGRRIEVISTYDGTPLRIEIKPVVGDDYPAVLRQMKNNGSRYLFLDRYEGVGATREQFVATFAASGLTVVFKPLVDQEMGQASA